MTAYIMPCMTGYMTGYMRTGCIWCDGLHNGSQTRLHTGLQNGLHTGLHDE